MIRSIRKIFPSLHWSCFKSENIARSTSQKRINLWQLHLNTELWKIKNTIQVSELWAKYIHIPKLIESFQAYGMWSTAADGQSSILFRHITSKTDTSSKHSKWICKSVEYIYFDLVNFKKQWSVSPLFKTDRETFYNVRVPFKEINELNIK